MKHEQRPACGRRRDHEPPAAMATWGWRYHHLGIPTHIPRSGEVHLPHLGMHVSGFPNSPYGIEWMRFDRDSPISNFVRTIPHVAFEVNDLDAAIRGKTLQGKVSSPSKGIRVAMIVDDGALIELIEFRGRRTKEDLARQITEMERRLARAQRERNRRELEALLEPEYQGINPHGRRMTRAEFIEAYTSSELKLQKLAFRGLSVRGYGAVALASGRSAFRGAYLNKPFSSAAMFTDTWLRHEDGSWRLIASQVTPVSRKGARRDTKGMAGAGAAAGATACWSAPVPWRSARATRIAI